MSGFSLWSKAVSPAEEKLVGTPGHVVATSTCSSAVTRKRPRPPEPATAWRIRAPSRSEIVPPGMPKPKGTAVGSPARSSASSRPTAPAWEALRPFASNEQPPRVASAIAPASDLAGSVVPHSWRPTGRPSVPLIVPTSITCWSALTHAGGIAPGAGTNGIGPMAAGATSVRALVKTWLFAVAATLMASGAVEGEPTVPSPKRSRSLPAEMTGTTPALTTLFTTRTIGSRAGSLCGPPPEKLMTSIPSATAASNAAMISGVLALQQPPSGAGWLNTR